MSPRFEALKLAGSRSKRLRDHSQTGDGDVSGSHMFGMRVFGQTLMEQMLPKAVFRNIMAATAGHEELNPAHADLVAIAMKEWAVSNGATHYCHWFHPLSGATAEKHDSFIDWSGPDGVIEHFGGAQLIQGEPDASSFPSGGLRCTYEARGYTGWDPSSPVFLWNAGDGLTLFVPSVFFSWTGDVLDSKIPLLRSDRLINKASLRLLRLTGKPASQVFSTLGWEQEYFVIDRALFNLRPDLSLLGRTVFGAPSAKGQQLQDHYFGAVKDRILAYMQDFEDEAVKLAIPVKTRHNEVAPAQHEVAPIFEKSSIAVDHNIILMELMRLVANRHDLACLLQEKPFAGINGSGKHHNWSLATDTGLNLLEPGESPECSLQFIILLTAIVAGVHKHQALLRAVVASAGNDLRLGGHEAPPAIISVFLGDALEAVLIAVEESTDGGKGAAKRGSFDLGIPVIPTLPKDNTDRNRTSPFAFTGNKFEFRAPGSSVNCAEAVTVLNIAVAESLTSLLDAIESKLGSASIPPSADDLARAALPVVRESLKTSRGVRFTGDNYSQEWEEEAARRGLANEKQAPFAYEAFVSEQALAVFKGVLTASELASRYEILQETYCHIVEIEANLMLEIFRTQILPAAQRHQKSIAQSLAQVQQVLGLDADIEAQQDGLRAFVGNLAEAILAIDSIEDGLQELCDLEHAPKARALATQVLPCCARARSAVDRLEQLTDDKEWPLPKYRELLYIR